MNRPLNRKRGPHYVYRLYDRSGQVIIDHGNGWRMSRQMRERNFAAEILQTCATEEEAFELAQELRRKSANSTVDVIGSLGEIDKDPISRERIQSIVEWNLQSISKYPPTVLAELCNLHQCDTQQELTAKLIADCLFYRL